MTTITSRDLNRDVSAAKRAAAEGPVTITDHGRRTHVLMTAEEYDKLTGANELAGRRLVMRGYEDTELEVPARGLEQRDIDL